MAKTKASGADKKLTLNEIADKRIAEWKINPSEQSSGTAKLNRLTFVSTTKQSA